MADDQTAVSAKSVGDESQEQCSQTESDLKTLVQKETQAAKNACAKNQVACDNAKTKAKNAVTRQIT
ncbi:late histone H1 [Pseudescherichia vulneris]